MATTKFPQRKKKKINRLAGQVSLTKVDVDPACVGAYEDASNADKGLLYLPVELHGEVLCNYLNIVPFTKVPHDGPVLPEEYLERTDVLRALSQVCVAYRRQFLPILWETLNVCCEAREESGANPASFFKHIGEALGRKCDGFSISPDLRAYVKVVNVVLTRYRSAIVIPKFPVLLQSLPNLHILHLLHTHTQMMTALEAAFEGVVIPTIRTLIIQGYCHDILKCCPNVTTVWCIRDDGRKLLPVIETHCKFVEELRGFSGDDRIIKKIVKAAPNLRVFDMWYRNYKAVLKHLPSFKKMNTIVIKTFTTIGQYPDEMELLQECIKQTRLNFKALPETREKKHIHVVYDDTGHGNTIYSTTHRHTVQYVDADRILAWRRDPILGL
ncbi:hypothetical protein GALMADRAFT_384480 [Galerina marginata CBS 339.88]|uniref:Uncharacterized protein n=1 Tax=Galerina marginata (strain CBS 339.88) TaxID=685588 RepID=A0A067TR84_GALM3|nr:hypothetical protein GALMADRAFT_384480 [Galerina marginata CBS 339.88]